MNKIRQINIKEFENIYDLSVLPNIYLVARLDGRSFSSLTKKMNLNKPFDDSFQEVMSAVVSTIMQDSGFNILYGYTQSDEISLLFNKEVDSFSRRINKYISTLASLAASVFTSKTNQIVSFDCRLSHLPTLENVIDYFQWRQHDAARNALSGYCYWKLRENDNQKNVTKILNKKNASWMQELLYQHGINYNDIPNWHKQGTGFYWIHKEVNGFNPITNTSVIVNRKKLYQDTNLSFGQDYSNLLNDIINKSYLSGDKMSPLFYRLFQHLEDQLERRSIGKIKSKK